MTNNTIELHKTLINTVKTRMEKTITRIAEAIENGDYAKVTELQHKITKYNTRLTEYLKELNEAIELENTRIKNDDSLNSIEDKINNQREKTIETVIAVVKHGKKTVEDIFNENQLYMELKTQKELASGDFNVWLEAESKNGSKYRFVGYHRLIDIKFDECVVKQYKNGLYLVNESKNERYILKYNQ